MDLVDYILVAILFGIFTASSILLIPKLRRASTWFKIAAAIWMAIRRATVALFRWLSNWISAARVRRLQRNVKMASRRLGNGQWMRVRGIQYEGREHLAKALKVGIELEMIREPENKHDPNAIRFSFGGVFGSMMLGYMDRERAEHYAPRMDAGEQFSAIVVKLPDQEGQSTDVQQVVVEVSEVSYQDPKTDERALP